MLKLAKQLLSLTGLRQGGLSKAARLSRRRGVPREEYANGNSADRRESHGRAGLEASLDLAFTVAYHEELWRAATSRSEEHTCWMLWDSCAMPYVLFWGIVPRKRALTYVIYLPGGSDDDIAVSPSQPL